MTICTLLGKGITCQTEYQTGDADINHARNDLCHRFLDSGYGTMLFLDSDISWPVSAVMALIDSKKPIIGGVYPKKTVTEEYVVRPINGAGGARVMPVEGLGGGFLMIRREALEKFSAFHKDRHYTDQKGKDRVAFFNGGLHEGRILSEDLDFCEACRRAGIDIFAYTDIDFGHSGNKEWTGNYAEWMNRQAQKAQAA